MIDIVKAFKVCYNYSGQNMEAIYMNFKRPEIGIWKIFVTPLEVYSPGYFDLWLPVSELLSGRVTFLDADPFITLTAPFKSTHARYSQGRVSTSSKKSALAQP